MWIYDDDDDVIGLRDPASLAQTHPPGFSGWGEGERLGQVGGMP